MKTILAAATSLAALCTPALAEDSYFDGFYAGIYGSIGDMAPGETTFAGVIAGYRWTLAEAFILGIEAQAGPGLIEGNYNASELFVLGQAGVQVGDNLLVFASAGYGARQEYSGGVSNYPQSALGLGLEFASSEFVTFRAEVQSTSYNNYSDGTPAYRANFGVLTSFD